MKVFDLLTDADDDLMIRGGDLEIGESTEQHQRHLLLSEKGDWRRTPYVGVGIRSLLNDDAPGGVVVAEIQEQMELDGQNVTALGLATNGDLNLQAYYKDNA
jgi:hypothetical protein